MTAKALLSTQMWLAIVALALTVGAATISRAQGTAVDPAAVEVLKQMTDTLGGLERFGVHTQVTLEDMLDSGHRVDYDVSSRITIARPNMLRAERLEVGNRQYFYYDGDTLALYDPDENVYATEAAPDTIEGVLDYTRESLGLIVPAADLVYRNAFNLLMQDVDLATVVGKAVIDGVSCDHLLFSRPGVDFQVWVADGDTALPCKYVVTDRGNPGRVSVTTVMSDWDLAAAVDDEEFRFVPPPGAMQIPFLRLDAATAPTN